MAVQAAECRIPLNGVATLHVVADDIGAGAGTWGSGYVDCGGIERGFSRVE